jgi:DNA-directed RNA polymerase
VDDHLDELRNIGRAARDDVEVDETLLSDVDDRFQFVRGCIELYLANNNPEFVSRLPLLFDASSNGLQHFCMLTRDQDGGRMVNLVPNLPPQDVYRETRIGSTNTRSWSAMTSHARECMLPNW